MENKRIIIAVAISFAVLLGWQYLFPSKKTAPPPEKTVQTQAAGPAETAKAPAQGKGAAAMAKSESFAPVEGREIKVDTPLYTAVFSSQGGVLLRFDLKKYKQTIQPESPDVDLVTEQSASKAPMGLIVAGIPTWSKAQWSDPGKDLSLEKDRSATLTFTGKLDNLTITRTLTFQGDNYLIEEEAVVANHGTDLFADTVGFTAATSSLSSADNRYNPTRVSYFGPGGLTEENDVEDLEEKGLQVTENLKWGSIQSNYFILALVPGEATSTLKARVSDKVFRLAVEEEISVSPNMQAKAACRYYFGPCDRDMLEAAGHDLSQAVNFGWFDFIAKPLLIALVWFNQYVHNYGVAIILLTIVIKLLFWPLSQKSYKSMNQMRKLQPMMAKLREKYKDDKQKLNQELMALYKTYKVNPAGGCVPMLLQIPVFFGLYKALLGAIELRHAVFIKYLPFTHNLWLADLSAKDPYYITPLIMGVTMFLQQKMTPAAGDPTQQKIMMLMPVIFTFIFLNFPSGLVIYWMSNNILSIAQQWWMLKKSDTPKGKGGRERAKEGAK